MKRNPYLSKLDSSYLFVEINKRKLAFLKQNPKAALISLGIGNTTEPLGEHIVKAMMSAALDQGIREHYVGYGPEEGLLSLREEIAKSYYNSKIEADDIFISDGAKCDLGRLQGLFGHVKSVAIQDPAYPVYIDGSLLQGIPSIQLMPCLEENDFFPDLNALAPVDLIYICSPNNPTGATYSKEQLQTLVDFARNSKAILLFDAAYSAYIRDPTLPKSIYEIKGAKEVAIEMQSFSKSSGFTGIRLGFTVVPKELQYEEGTSIQKDWRRIHSTLFNGASILSQKGGLAALSPQGALDCKSTLNHYLKNASLLKEAFESIGFKVYGGINAPYLWVKTPHMSSWEAFQFFLEKGELLVTPGSGFGPAGEGFIRISAFGSQENIEMTLQRLKRAEAFSQLELTQVQSELVPSV